ncbi:MAG: hypothetical protein V1703_02705 [Candidatus Altiarchaeota archaeon]
MRVLWVFLAVVSAIIASGCLCGTGSDEQTAKTARQAMATNNPSLCETLNSSLYIDSCYSQVALGLRDGSICNNISEPSVADECSFSVAIKTATFGPCMDMEDDQMKALCMAQVASTKAENIKEDIGDGWDKVKSFFTGEKSPCDEIMEIEPDKIDSCYKYAAINSNHSKYCSQIGDGEKRVDCYRIVAVNKKDDTVCLDLEAAADKDKFPASHSILLKTFWFEFHSSFLNE